jgi:PTS system fructose-specific IIC component/PTS system nitrogen regulatory IIA component
MELQELFPAERIKLGLESLDKDELFEELTEVLVRQARPKAGREAIVAALRRREALMSTGVARGLALPHAQVAGLDASYGVIGISIRGIDYDALDDRPVHLVILLVSPEQAPEEHLGILDHLGALFEDPGFLQAMLDSPDAHAAFRTLQKFWSILARSPRK